MPQHVLADGSEQPGHAALAAGGQDDELGSRGPGGFDQDTPGDPGDDPEEPSTPTTTVMAVPSLG